MRGKPSVLIVGAGFGGLAAAIELTRHGYREVTILEKADGLGGVWRDNVYPGAACDAPSDLYSFSYAPNPRWPKRFAEQRDILAYLHDVARRYRVLERIRFGVEIASADFDDTTGVWRLTATDGRVFEADVFVPALGQLSRPVVPKIPGARTFRGAQFHSARWDRDLDLAGKRVAVIGTGASAIQIVPAIASEVRQLTVFQRSAPWIIPKLEGAYLPPRLGPLGRPLPLVPRAERLWWFAFYETVTRGLDGSGPVADVVTAWANRHRARHVPDPELLAKVTPDYQAGCKRGLMSNDYYPALMRDNVALETSPIRKITGRGVVTSDGVAHAADVIVYCTGFAATEFLAPLRIRGLGGKDLAEEWSSGARAYLGIAVAHFPNMFLMYGPNTNLGAGSIVFMHERQARYLRCALDHLGRTRSAYLAVRPDAEERYDAEIQQRLAHTVWTRCTSWYRDANGRVTTNWPGSMREYDRRTKRFDAQSYEVAAPLP